MLSTTLPVRCAVAPQELLPIMPPSVQVAWGAGSRPNRNPVASSCRFSSSSTIPGWITHRRASASTDSTLVQYLDQSSTTAVFVHCPARLVPPPRDSTGTPNSRATATASTAASGVSGSTTPIGTCRKFEASVEYAARVPLSNRTSPSTRRASSAASPATSHSRAATPSARRTTGAGRSTDVMPASHNLAHQCLRSGYPTVAPAMHHSRNHCPEQRFPESLGRPDCRQWTTGLVGRNGAEPAGPMGSAECPKGRRAERSAPDRSLPHWPGRDRGWAVLRSRIAPPPLPLNHIARPELLDRLAEAARQRVALVLAGPGYGKTTLLATFAAAHGCAWLSLEREDAELASFLPGLLGAIRQALPGVG